MLVTTLPDPGQIRFMVFFTANIRNPNTYKAYVRSAGRLPAMV